VLVIQLGHCSHKVMLSFLLVMSTRSRRSRPTSSLEDSEVDNTSLEGHESRAPRTDQK
jgi:hypothetical protein